MPLSFNATRPAPAEPEPVSVATGLVADELALVRLPIADARGAVEGYELRFARASADGTETDPGTNARATATMVVDAFADIGLDKLCGRHPAWLSIARDFLVAVGVPPVRPDRCVIQIAAYPAADDLLTVMRRLNGLGYTLALSEYDGRTGLGDLVDLCSVVKLPVAGVDDAALAARMAPLRARGQLLVASGVDDEEALERCRTLGFDRIQGDVLARPFVVRGREVGTINAGSLGTLADLASGQLTFEELERIITSDVGLSLKLLRYVNSAFFALPRTIDTVREAVTLLGARTVQRWAMVVVLAAGAETRDELVSMALLRARLCESLADTISPEDRDRAFTVGLFSVADALLGLPMQEVLDTLPFSGEIKGALLRLDGGIGKVLGAVLAWERGEFPDLPEIAGPAFGAAYREALSYASAATAAVG